MSTGGEAAIVAVDVGNTSIKFGLFEAAALKDRAAWQPLRTLRMATSDGDFSSLISFLPAHVCWRIGSVNRSAAERLRQWLSVHRGGESVRWFAADDVGLARDVEFPRQVGVDRLLAGLAAANWKRKDAAAIVVNSGTAITVDLISADRVFLGGAIFPGVQTMARALHEQTDALPLLETNDTPVPQYPGRSTVDALRVGLHLGLIGAVRHLVGAAQKRAGGSAEVFLASRNLPLGELGIAARETPYLVLLGLLLAGGDDEAGPCQSR